MNLAYFYLLLDRQFLVVAFAAIATFATILTLGLPYMRRDTLGQRMKAVGERREELRLRQREALAQAGKRGQLRSTPVGFMKSTLDNLKIEKLVESPGMREKLARAGWRGQGPVVSFMFFRFAMPPVLFVGALIYLFGISTLDWSLNMKLLAAIGAALAGYYAPDIFVSNRIQARRDSIMRAFPDALDLMLICVESGMSIEAAFNRVAQEVGGQSVELAEELALTTAELSYLPDRRVAFQNLAQRCGHSGVKSVAAALIQSEKYGTPMGQALRVTAQENREMRMAEAERKAASLPSKLTVPMIVFFLPCLFIVILGPAALKVLGYVK
ncbi:MAG TPA: type II secretion system F family protein [Micropepsaceae bacterium]|jgi:tight adherence protein C|nr:type II secretion system F family protein [Micropepsaceae bacterium]